MVRAFGIVKNADRSIPGQFFDVELPIIKDDEVLIKVRSAGLNYNSLWSLARSPADPFQLLSSMVARNPDRGHHLLPYQIIGSDASGTVEEVGRAVSNWKVGDEVVVHCSVVDPNDPVAAIDDLLSESEAIWGYETNFGAFATHAIVRAHQLHRKPPQLSWDDAASYMLTHTTAYRMLLSENGARLKQGETCLIWGAAGGLGLFAIQLAKLVGAVPIAVVSSEDRGKICRSYGADLIINRTEMKHALIDDEGMPNPLAWREWKRRLSQLGVDAPDVVFEHVGRETLAASIYLARRGGRVVTCAASSGYESFIDLRYLWMNVKSLIGSHISNRFEAAEAHSLVANGAIRTTVTDVAPFDELPALLSRFRNGDIAGKAVVSIDGYPQ